MHVLAQILSGMKAGLPLPANAVAWFKGENNTNDEGGLYNGSAGGSVAYGTGHGSGNGFSFSGVNNNNAQRILIPSINAGSSFAIEFYMRVTSVGGSGTAYTLFGNAFADATKLGEIYVTNDTINYWSNSLQRVITPTGIISLSTWYKVTLVYNGSTSKCKLYINDMLYVTESGTHSESYNNQAGIGYPVSGVATSPIGVVDEVVIYNSAIVPTVLNNLVAWYTGDNVLTDSAYTWDCTATTPAYAVGTGGSANTAFSFNGTLAGCVKQQANFRGAEDGTSWSVVADLYFSSTGNTGYRDIWGNNFANTTSGLGTLYMNGGKLEYWHSSALKVQGTTTIPTNTYVNIKVTWSSVDSKVRVYYNGVLEGSASSGTHTENFGTGLFFGGSRTGNTGYFTGRLDDIKIYNALV